MNMLKQKLEEAILAENVQELEVCLSEYEKVCPADYDIYSYYVSYYLMLEDAGNAQRYAKAAVKVNPFSVEANYNYAVCAELQGDFVKAYDYFRRAKHLQEKYALQLLDAEELEDKITKLKEEAIHAEAADELNICDVRFRYAIEDPFRNGSQDVLGKMIVDSKSNYYFIGRYQDWFEAYFQPEIKLNAVQAKCELHPIAEYGKDYSVEAGDGKVLVPIVVNPTLKQEDNLLLDNEITMDNAYTESASLKYSHIPVERRAEFHSYENVVFAEPLPLRQTSGKQKKRLVLNIFIDSLNEKLIKQYGLKELMPYTEKFFQNAMQCEQYYSCSEYTLPSIATYWTGKHASRHMNLDNEYRHDFMGEQRNLAEYFKEAGYVTSKLGGNDAITPAQGYVRGIDNFVYQLNAEGMTIKEIVTDTIEQLETFQEANQFIWLDIVDLHHVAGGFMRSQLTEAQVPLQARFLDSDVITTVKQSRSHNREQIYIAEMKKIDVFLSLLYHYLEENYKEEELLVTFFSDHGTAFLVDNEEPFISWQRVNVPLMIKNHGIPAGVCEEVIQATDYAGILCKLAGIAYDYTDTDGNLPVCLGGTTEREYAFSQSIFPGDPYVAGMHGKNLHVYYDSKRPVENEFRIDIQDSEIWAVDDAGADITEQIETERFRDEIERRIGHLMKR